MPRIPGLKNNKDEEKIAAAGNLPLRECFENGVFVPVNLPFRQNSAANFPLASPNLCGELGNTLLGEHKVLFGCFGISVAGTRIWSANGGKAWRNTYY